MVGSEYAPYGLTGLDVRHCMFPSPMRRLLRLGVSELPPEGICSFYAGHSEPIRTTSYLTGMMRMPPGVPPFVEVACSADEVRGWADLWNTGGRDAPRNGLMLLEVNPDNLRLIELAHRYGKAEGTLRWFADKRGRIVFEGEGW